MTVATLARRKCCNDATVDTGGSACGAASTRVSGSSEGWVMTYAMPLWEAYMAEGGGNEDVCGVGCASARCEKGNASIVLRKRVG